MCPLLAEQSVTAIYAGLRPATQFKDYQIEALPDRNWITVGGIRSTGLTGALGIAAACRASSTPSISARCARSARASWTPVPNLAEHLPRPYQQPGAGEIVCHCELVTRGEIDAALARPAARRRPRRPEAPHPLHDGPLPGLLLQRAGSELAQVGCERPCTREPGRVTEHQVLIVGGGPAGLSAARRSLASACATSSCSSARARPAASRAIAATSASARASSRLLTGPAYARRLVESARNIQIRTASPLRASSLAVACTWRRPPGRQRWRGAASCWRPARESRRAPPGSCRATGRGVWSPPEPCSRWSISEAASVRARGRRRHRARILLDSADHAARTHPAAALVEEEARIVAPGPARGSHGSCSACAC